MFRSKCPVNYDNCNFVNLKCGPGMGHGGPVNPGESRARCMACRNSGGACVSPLDGGLHSWGGRVVCLVWAEKHRIFRQLTRGDARATMRRSQPDRSVLFQFRFVTMLVLGGAILPATTWAALPQVSNLKVQSAGT